VAKEATLQVRMDSDMKERVEALYQRMGTTFAEGVRMFAAQSLLIDANVILRHLLRDVEEQSAQARIIIAGGAYTTTEVLAEVVYVLQGVYKIPRDKIQVALTALLGEVLTDHADVVVKALEIYASKNLDFVDCVLIARACVLGDDVFTFDKKLNATLRRYLDGGTD